jgi:hypothetical protein
MELHLSSTHSFNLPVRMILRKEGQGFSLPVVLAVAMRAASSLLGLVLVVATCGEITSAPRCLSPSHANASVRFDVQHDDPQAVMATWTQFHNIDIDEYAELRDCLRCLQDAVLSPARSATFELFFLPGADVPAVALARISPRHRHHTQV